MWSLLCSLLLIYPGVALSPAWMYDQEYLRGHIEVRLLKNDWKPNGPSANTDEVLEEYKWSVEEAFNALKTSNWQFDSAVINKADRLFRGDNYDNTKDTIFIIHPICASADVFFVKTTVTALAMRNLHKKYNIFAVNMPALNPQMMLSVFLTIIGLKTYYEPMAEAVSQFLVIGVDMGFLLPEKTHLVSWSYSGQLVGYMGRYVQARFGKKLATILSLDPYSNGLNKNLIHLSAEDARVVHIYHSNSPIAGTRERIGTADFVFNDGVIQPECAWPAVLRSTIKESMICSHLKAVQRLWYVILYPSKFVGTRCASWTRYTECFCEGNPTVTLTYPIRMNSQAEGIYYLRTLGTKPYGLGKWGNTCTSTKLLSKKIENRKLLTI